MLVQLRASRPVASQGTLSEWLRAAQLPHDWHAVQLGITLRQLGSGPAANVWPYLTYMARQAGNRLVVPREDANDFCQQIYRPFSSHGRDTLDNWIRQGWRDSLCIEPLNVWGLYATLYSESGLARILSSTSLGGWCRDHGCSRHLHKSTPVHFELNAPQTLTYERTSKLVSETVMLTGAGYTRQLVAPVFVAVPPLLLHIEGEPSLKRDFNDTTGELLPGWNDMDNKNRSSGSHVPSRNAATAAMRAAWRGADASRAEAEARRAAGETWGFIVSLGRPEDIAMGIAMLEGLRSDHGCNLPVEVFHAEELAAAATSRLQAIGRVHVRQVKGLLPIEARQWCASQPVQCQSAMWRIKPLALLQSSFDVVFMIDADVIFFQVSALRRGIEQPAGFSLAKRPRAPCVGGAWLMLAWLRQRLGVQLRDACFHLTCLYSSVDRACA